MILYIIIYRKLKQSNQTFSTVSSNRAEKRVSIILAFVVINIVFTYLPITLFSILGQILQIIIQMIPNYFLSLFYCYHIVPKLDPLFVELVKVVIAMHQRVYPM